MTAVLQWGRGNSFNGNYLLLILILLFSFGIFFPQDLHAKGNGDLLFLQQGYRFVSGWKVKDVEKHSEFIRLGLIKNKQKTAIEIVENKGSIDRWSGKYYRIQPAPESNPPLFLLENAVRQLRELESSPDHVFLLKDIRYKDKPGNKASVSEPAVNLDLAIEYDLSHEKLKLWFALIILMLLTFMGYVAGINSAVGKADNTEKTIKHVKNDISGSVQTLVRSCTRFLKLLRLDSNFYPTATNDKYLTLRFLAIALLSLVFFVIWAIDPPLVGDTYQFMLYAKDCFTGNKCHFKGTDCTVSGIYLGGLWGHFLLFLQHINLSLFDAHIIVTFSYALGVGFVYIGCYLFVSRKLAFLTAAFYLFLSLEMVEYPILWNDSLLPFFMGIFIYSFLAALTNGTLFSLVVASISLALCTECHLITSVLIPPFLLSLILIKNGSSLRFLLGMMLICATVTIFSFEAHYNNLMFLVSSGLIIPVVASCLVIWLVGLCIRDKFRAYWSINKNLSISYLLLLYVLAILSILSIYSEHQLKIAYFEPALMGFSLMLAHLTFNLNMLLVTNSKRLFRVNILNVRRMTLVAVIIIVFAWVQYYRHEQVEEDTQGWTTSDVHTLAHFLYSKGYDFNYLNNHLRGPDRSNLLRALLAHELDHQANIAEEMKDGHDILILKLHKHEWLPEKLPENLYTVPLKGGARAVIREFQSIIDRNDVKMCVEIPGNEQSRKCFNAPIWKPFGDITEDMYYRDQFLLLENDVKSIFTIRGYKIDTDKKLKFSMTFKTYISRTSSTKYLGLVNNIRCAQWKIEQIDKLKYKGKLPDSNTLLADTVNTTGTVTISTEIGEKDNSKVYIPSMVEINVETINPDKVFNHGAVNTKIIDYSPADSKEDLAGTDKSNKLL